MASYASLADPLKAKVDERFKREFRFNPQYEDTVRSINERLAGLGSAEEHGKRRLEEDYTSQQSKLRQAHGEGIKSLQERLANQGILRSGINVEEQGNMATQLQQAEGELGTQKSRGIEDLVRELTGQRQGLETEKRGAETGRAREEADFRDTLAREEAEREANDTFKAQQAEQLDQLRNKVLELSQPQPTPTGQLIPPPPLPPIEIPQMPAYQPPRAAAPLPPPPPPGIPKVNNNMTAQYGVAPVDLQKMLQIRGYDPGPLDGRIGPRTQQALQAWKQSVGLPNDAYFDQIVWDWLKSTGTGNIGGQAGVTRTGPARRSV